MPTAKQIAANVLNAQKSTGPKTSAGKDEAAANSLKHGMTAKKYLTRDEDHEEFEALYLARRKLYPADDRIIDSLVLKITLSHWRLDRGFRAEAEMLTPSSLAEVLVSYDKPIKNLTSYEASNRRTLKLLDEELTRYLSMLAEIPEPDVTEAPSPEIPPSEKTALPVPAKDPSTAATTSDVNPKTNPISIMNSEAPSPSVATRRLAELPTASAPSAMNDAPVSTSASPAITTKADSNVVQTTVSAPPLQRQIGHDVIYRPIPPRR